MENAWPLLEQKPSDIFVVGRPGCGFESFAVHQKSLIASRHDEIVVAINKGHHLLQTVGRAHIIRVHPNHVLGFRFGEQLIQGGSQSPVLSDDQVYTRVVYRLEVLCRSVPRYVVDDEEMKVIMRLSQDALNG